jgi:cyclophilin family peptidyl-prolyl cis-trans isomerase
VELEKGGVFTIQLLPDVAPRTVQNFFEKAGNGFYNGLTFHRVEDWVVQGGDPRGNGTGGNMTLATELSDRPFGIGSVGVARLSNETRVSNDAQFFICLKPSPHLNGGYTNFGQVVAGMDVVQAIQRGDRIKQIRVQG